MSGTNAGSCQVQHRTSVAQREAKARIVTDALTRIGGSTPSRSPFEAADREWEYRAKILAGA
jgi:tRNA/tmRNA/rRNA uracil-C5-methylase (TrmA/RlmC/RlmD family)